MVRTVISPLLAAMTCCAAVAAASEPWVIHEWGTFTSLQDENGRTISGLNSDDEPLPSFVHRIAPWPGFIDASGTAPAFQQGAPRNHRDVTMRLETPVIYFHPPAGATLPQRMNVQVTFHGGWLTEFFPDAQHVEAPGAPWGRITSQTAGALTWRGLRVGTGRRGPATDEHVWLAPRRVQSAAVTTPAGESEQYLFYRGVGRVEAPLRVRGTAGGTSLRLESHFAHDDLPLTISRAWWVDITHDGQVAFQPLGPLEVVGESQHLADLPAALLPREYRPENLDILRSDMHAALQADGLFADEAQALLSTWELSYFRSPGLRLFFLVPRSWTDQVLPLRVSIPAETVRVMVAGSRSSRHCTASC